MPDRLIKESSCISDTLNALSDFGERFWWRLTVNCDDYGRCDARPAVLKSKLFPLADDRTPADMTTAIHELSSVGLITVYSVEGRPYLQIVTWGKHQRIRAKRSKYPAPEEGTRCQMTANDSECPRNPIQSESKSNTKSKAEIGAQVRFTPPTVGEVAEYCMERGNGVDAEQFVDFYSSKGWKVGSQPMKDWKAAVRTWEKRDGGKTVSAQAYSQRTYTEDALNAVGDDLMTEIRRGRMAWKF